VTARLFMQARLRFQDVTVRGPAVGCATGNLSAPEVTGRGAAMPCRELELGGRILVELGLRRQSLVQFQTLTSR
jgi:hypothetical protein